MIHDSNQEFCKAFNKRTEAFKDNTLLPVILTAYTDRSFEFSTKTPPVSWFIRQACGLEVGSGATGVFFCLNTCDSHFMAEI